MCIQSFSTAEEGPPINMNDWFQTLNNIIIIFYTLCIENYKKFKSLLTYEKNQKNYIVHNKTSS